MDEKKMNNNGLEPEANQSGKEQDPNVSSNENNAQENNAQATENQAQENNAQAAENQTSQESQSSGWVFSSKNAAGEHEQEKKEGGFFHHEHAHANETSKQPDQDGWYRSGPRSEENKSAYSSRYSYGAQENGHNPYEAQPTGDPKTSESYKWNYEDYKQEKPKHTPKAKKNKGLRVFAIIMCGILCAGVVSLAGYGTYALVSGNNTVVESESAEVEDAQNSTTEQLTLNDKPAGGSSSASANLQEGELTITERAEKVMPSAVGIVAYIQSQQSIFGGEQSQGSGIIATQDGYIITNAHVVEGATSIKVVLSDTTEYNATLVGSDEKTDLAVLKIEATGLTPAEFGNSDQLEIGEQVITVGNPGGLELAGSVTVGYVSAMNRSITTTTGNTVDCIQTDAAINPGNSGGALVNTYGQVVGINSQKIAATEYEGIGFAISINEAQPIINDLIQYGYVRGRVWMGITMKMIDQTTAQMYGYQVGAGVVSVTENSPAAKAGLVAGDIITAIDGQSIDSSETLTGILQEHKPGDTITLTVFRQSRQSFGQDQEVTLQLELGEEGAPTETTDTAAQQNTQNSQNSQNNQGSVWGLN